MEEGDLKKFQEWWGTNGSKFVDREPILAISDQKLLQQVIAKGANYHLIITADRLHDLVTRCSKHFDNPRVEPLRQALSKGTVKGQARNIGNLFFSTAFNLYQQLQNGTAPPMGQPMGQTQQSQQHPVSSYTQQQPVQRAPSPIQVPPQMQPPAAFVQSPTPQSPSTLDEVYNPPRSYTTSPAFPGNASLAARRTPTADGDVIQIYGAGSTFLANGRVGNFIRMDVRPEEGGGYAYVCAQAGDMTLLVPTAASSVAPPVTAATPSGASTGVGLASSSSSGSGDVSQLEATVRAQQREIDALNAKVNKMASQLSAIANAFTPLM